MTICSTSPRPFGRLKCVLVIVALQRVTYAQTSVNRKSERGPSSLGAEPATPPNNCRVEVAPAVCFHEDMTISTYFHCRVEIFKARAEFAFGSTGEDPPRDGHGSVCTTWKRAEFGSGAHEVDGREWCQGIARMCACGLFSGAFAPTISGELA